MQITVKEAKFLKEGTNNKGAWRLFKVVSADDGTEYTTFDTKADHLSPGTIIEIGDITIKDGDKRSFKELAVVSKAATTPGPNGDGNMSKEDWEKKQRIERASFEAQTAVKVILSMEPGGDDLSKEVRVKALMWCAVKIDANMNGAVHQDIKTRMAPDVKDTVSGDDEELWPKFKNVGEFFTACLKKGISRPEVMKKLGLREGDDLSKLDLAQAWETVNEKVTAPTS